MKSQSLMWLCRYSQMFCVISAYISPPDMKLLLPEVAYFGHRNHKPIKYNCLAAGDPPPKYQWLFSRGQTEFRIFKGAYPYVYLNHSLLIIKQGLIFDPRYPEYIGYYRCLAKNKYGVAVSTAVKVERYVFDPFYVLNSVQVAVTAYADQYLKLFCKNKPDIGLMAKVRFKWTRDNTTDKHVIQSEVLLGIQRFAVDQEGDFHILRTESEDTRNGRENYVCHVHNQDDVSLMDSYGSYTKVTILPETRKYSEDYAIAYGSRTTIVNLGATFTLQCIPRGLPIPNVVWTKRGGHAITSIQGRVLIHEYTRELNVKSASIDDEGTYRCHLDLDPRVYKDIAVVVVSKPIPYKPPKNAVVNRGRSKTFFCTAKPDYNFGVLSAIFFKDALIYSISTTIFRASTKPDGHPMILTDLSRPGDLMSAACLLRNGVGRTYIAFTLNVIDKINFTKFTLFYRDREHRVKEHDFINSGQVFKLERHQFLELDCEVEHDPLYNDVFYTWYYNGIEVTNYDDGRGVTVKNGTSRVFFPWYVHPGDNWTFFGDYSCRASLFFAKNPETDTYFNVTFAESKTPVSFLRDRQSMTESKAPKDMLTFLNILVLYANITFLVRMKYIIS